MCNFREYIFFVFNSFLEVEFIYKFVIISTVQQRIQVYTYTHPFSFRFFSHIDYHRIQGRVLCALQQVPVYIFIQDGWRYAGIQLHACTPLFVIQISHRLIHLESQNLHLKNLFKRIINTYPTFLESSYGNQELDNLRFREDWIKTESHIFKTVFIQLECIYICGIYW